MRRGGFAGEREEGGVTFASTRAFFLLGCFFHSFKTLDFEHFRSFFFGFLGSPPMSWGAAKPLISSRGPDFLLFLLASLSSLPRDPAHLATSTTLVPKPALARLGPGPAVALIPRIGGTGRRPLQ